MRHIFACTTRGAGAPGQGRQDIMEKRGMRLLRATMNHRRFVIACFLVVAMAAAPTIISAEFITESEASNPTDITAGPDENLWFTDAGCGRCSPLLRTSESRRYVNNPSVRTNPPVTLLGAAARRVTRSSVGFGLSPTCRRSVSDRRLIQ